MTALSDAVIALLSEYAEGDDSPIADLKERIFIGLIPTGSELPACIVDVRSDHDPVAGLDEGIERAVVSIRVTDEDKDSDTADLATAVEDAFTGRAPVAPDDPVPPLLQDQASLDGWTILDVGRAGSRTYATLEEGQRWVHSLVELEITLERA